MGKQTLTYDADSVALSANAFTRTGYTFAGWATSSNGAVVYSNEALVSNLTTGTDDFVLYAKWTPVTKTVSFDLNSDDATWNLEEIDVTYGEDAKALPTTEFTYDGYSFGGWYDNEDLNGDAIEEVSDLTEDLTLYAKWIPNNYDVVFNPNAEDYEGTMDPQTLTYDGGLVALTQNEFVRAGFTFLGWSLTPDGEVKYHDQDKVENLTTDTNDYNLYAQWDEE
jgi:uncharacterized repeat protein (TIGR02543 family)